MAKSKGIQDFAILDTPLAIVDFETTGLNPGSDRVVEVSIVRIDPGASPVCVFDTLVNPNRPMGASEIHGITDSDVADAPRFDEIAGNFAEALAGCVVASYNVYFDIGFLNFELRNAGLKHTPPHLCVMYMRPMLNLGSRCSLGEACRLHSVPYGKDAHQSAADAFAAAALWQAYLPRLRERSIRTFGDMKKLSAYKFLESFKSDPLDASMGASLRKESRFKPRAKRMETASSPAREQEPPVAKSAIREYWDALKVAFADLEISPREIEALSNRQRALQLSQEEVRAAHARLYANVLTAFTDDRILTVQETEILKKVFHGLDRLGWAPGL